VPVDNAQASIKLMGFSMIGSVFIRAEFSLEKS